MDSAAETSLEIGKTVKLDQPIPMGDGFITEVIVTSPSVGVLMNISAARVLDFSFDTIVKLVPKCTTPQISALHINKGQVALSDLMSIHAEIAAFFLPKAAREEISQNE